MFTFMTSLLHFLLFDGSNKSFYTFHFQLQRHAKNSELNDDQPAYASIELN